MMLDPHSQTGKVERPASAAGSNLIWTGLAALGVFSGLAALVFANAPAGAMGGGGNPAAIVLRAEEAPSAPVSNLGNPEYRAHGTSASHAGFGGGVAVCVRLCDGYFFPSNGPSSNESCEAQCPDTPTALYREPAGSDRIEDAVSTSGASYSELPSAGRHRTDLDHACTCHAHSINYSELVLHDPTLRKGDVVMTPGGPVVYEGGQSEAPRREDFVALARDSTLPREMRATLSTMRSADWANQADRLSAK